MLTEQDEFRHKIAGPHARESLFYSLLLPEAGLMVVAYTWVDSEDRGGAMFIVSGDGDQRLVSAALDGIPVGDRDFDDWAVGGLEIRHPVPLQTVELSYGDDNAAFELEFEAAHRPFAYSENGDGCPPVLADDRFEQSGRARGRLSVAGREVPFDTTAHRDHSWGRRDWNALHHWKWLSGQAGPDTTFNALQLLADGRQWINGYVNRGGELTPLVGISVDTDYDDDFTQRRAAVRLDDAAGSAVTVEAERFAFVRINPNERMVMHEGGCRAEIDGRPGVLHYEMGWTQDHVASRVAGG